MTEDFITLFLYGFIFVNMSAERTEVSPNREKPVGHDGIEGTANSSADVV